MSDLARLRAHAKAIEKLPTAATWNFTTRERVVQRAREMLELLDGAVLLSGEQANPETLARRFHEAYERLAPSFDYETRPDSAVPWEQVPEQNRALMIATAWEVLLASPRPEGERA